MTIHEIINARSYCKPLRPNAFTNTKVDMRSKIINKNQDFSTPLSKYTGSRTDCPNFPDTQKWFHHLKNKYKQRLKK